MKLFSAVLLATISAAPALAGTTLLTADPHNGTTTVFTNTGLTYASGSSTLDGFSVTGTGTYASGNVTYGLSTNGTWNHFSWVGTDDATASITFNLGGSYNEVGAFLNYCPGCGGSDSTITALAADGSTILASYDLVTLAPILTAGQLNAGAFRGISSTLGDISFLRLTGNYEVAHSLEVGSGVTPEPSSFALLGTGLLGVVSMVRRRLA